MTCVIDSQHTLSPLGIYYNDAKFPCGYFTNCANIIVFHHPHVIIPHILVKTIA